MRYIPVYRVALVREKRLGVETKVISHPEDVAAIVRDYLQEPDREVVVVLVLSTKNEVIGINTVSIGTLDSSLVHPREVFKPVLLLNASSVILAHNHPSGDASPSPEDRHVSTRLMEAGKILGIEVIDHVIVGGNEYCSLRQQGML